MLAGRATTGETVADLPKHFVSVAGVVVDASQRVLVIQRHDNRRWEPPGGVLEPDETFDDGVRREVLEETGLEIEVERLAGVYKNMRREVVVVVFRCRAVGGSLRLSDETVDVAWLDLHDALSRMDEAYAVRVNDAFSDTPLARAQVRPAP